MVSPFVPPFMLYATSSEFIIHREEAQSSLIINRHSSEIKVVPGAPGEKVSQEATWGILGIADLGSSKVLITISSISFAGSIKDACIFSIKSLNFHPYVAESPVNGTISGMFKDLISTKSFYFSYDFNLTSPIYRQDRRDPNFFWNLHMLSELQTASADNFLVPVINGHVQIKSVDVQGKTVDFGLISRRDHRRTGTRFNTRGVDADGNAVNYVETEQIVGTWDSDSYVVHSLLQTRGSIPLLWKQKPNLKYMPRPKIFNDPEKNVRAATKHVNEMLERYSSVYMVNLIDKKGSQKMMGEAFTDLYNVMKTPQLHYIWFDFHHECRKMKYENLKKLLGSISGFIDKVGWSSVVVEGSFQAIKVLKVQNGVVRTNCMDCLDRTNVVQSVIGRHMLISQLNHIGIPISSTGEAFQALPGNLEKHFRGNWVDNADALSLLYTGTPAQKTDFTRLGKRTFGGMLNDGKYSLQRYLLNNFVDGYNQNAFDVFLGRCKSEKCPSRYRDLGIFVGLLLALCFICHLLSIRGSSGIGYYFIWILTFGLLVSLMMSKGTLFVSKPILNND